MPVTDIIKQLGFEKSTSFEGEVYSHDSTDILLVVEQDKTLIVSDPKNLDVISTVQNSDHFSILGALLYVSHTAKITGVSAQRIPIFIGIR